MGKAVFFYGAAWLAACSWAGTILDVAWRHPAAFGGWDVGPVTLFAPGQFVLWYGLVHPDDRWAIHAAGLVCLAFGALCTWKVWSAAQGGHGGPDRGRFQQTDDDLRGSGLL